MMGESLFDEKEILRQAKEQDDNLRIDYSIENRDELNAIQIPLQVIGFYFLFPIVKLKHCQLATARPAVCQLPETQPSCVWILLFWTMVIKLPRGILIVAIRILKIRIFFAFISFFWPPFFGL
jgi:hypothetical protein